MDILSLNKSLCVAFLHDNGVAAHKGLDLEHLQYMVAQVQEHGWYIPETEEEEIRNINPVDAMRNEVMEFVERHALILKPQLGCDGNCYNHPDGMVVHCYMNIKGELK